MGVVLSIITVLMSAASFVLSGYALWVAQFNHGRLKMTQPTLLCLKRELTAPIPKIFLRTLLFTTGNKGTVIQNMFLRVHHPGGTYTFDFWGHTEGGKLTLAAACSSGQRALLVITTSVRAATQLISCFWMADIALRFLLRIFAGQNPSH